MYEYSPNALGPVAPCAADPSVGSCAQPHEQPSIVRGLTRGDLEQLVPLFQTHPFNPYRNYRAFTRRAQTEVLLAEADEALSGPETFAFLAGGNQRISAAIARRLDWDSKFFGVPMARTDHLVGDPNGRREALGALLASLRAVGIRHVAARADVADLAGIAQLQDYKFRLMGGLSTYVARPRADIPKSLRSLGKIRAMRDGDAPQLVAVATEGFRRFHSRFHADARFPRDRADALYVEWTRRCAAREMADVVLVAEGEKGRLLGFLAFRRVEPVSTVCGLPVFGAGLGVCRPGSAGAYVGLMRTGILWAHENGGLAEVQTPSDNFAAIAVFEAVGLRLRRAEYVFHLWLD